MAVQPSDDFMILGPIMTSGNKVLEAIHALYYLPENFKLILTGSDTASQSFFKQVMAQITRDEVGHRVQFDADTESAQAIILPNTGMSRIRNSVAGDSPEALASAILDLVRSR